MDSSTHFIWNCFFQLCWDILDIQHWVKFKLHKIYWFDTSICLRMIPNTALANTCIMSHNYHSFFMVRTFNVFSLSNCQVYNTVLLAIISMLYINQNLFILELKVCTFWPTSSLSPNLSAFLVSASMSLAFLDSTCKWYHTVAVFL